MELLSKLSAPVPRRRAYLANVEEDMLTFPKDANPNLEMSWSGKLR